jgi:hypothetical protein
VRFVVPTATSMQMSVFWDVVPCVVTFSDVPEALMVEAAGTLSFRR